MTHFDPTPADRRWLAETWPFIRDHLPAAPATVLEIGCGPLGGFVPALLAAGYTAAGVDPHAPHGPAYHRTTFEDYRAATPTGAVIVCAALHHVASLDVVTDRIRRSLRPDGVLVVVEWDWERFDEATAQWCFARLPDRRDEPGWLSRHRDQWRDSGTTWDTYLSQWAAREGLHTGGAMTRALTTTFDTVLHTRAPYFFPELDATRGDEQTAIDARNVQATGIHYVGRPASTITTRADR